MLTSVRGLLAATFVAGTMLAATPAMADETDPPEALTVSGSVTLVSDYRFRGVSFTAGDPAIQGTINLNHESGLYAGVWASSLEDSPVYGSIETDVYAGWSGDIASGLTADVGLLYYVYPGGHVGKANVWEPYASLSTTIGPVSAKVGVAYAWDQASLGSQDNLYLYTNLDVAIPNTPLTVSGHVGYTDGVWSLDNDKTAIDWSLGASASLTDNLSVGVSYIGVEDGGVPAPFKKNFTDDTVVASITLSF